MPYLLGFRFINIPSSESPS